MTRKMKSYEEGTTLIALAVLWGKRRVPLQGFEG
jgi:hypothetical protein